MLLLPLSFQLLFPPKLPSFNDMLPVGWLKVLTVKLVLLPLALALAPLGTPLAPPPPPLELVPRPETAVLLPP